MSQIPHGPSDRFCPMWRKAMVKVCHTCPWWTKVTGVNPNSKNALAPETIDRWDCAISWLPMLAVNGARETFAVAEQMQRMRNETAANNAQQASNVAALNDNLIRMHGQNTQLALAQIRAATDDTPRAIEHRQ